MMNLDQESEDKNVLLHMKMKESKLYWKLRQQLLTDINNKFKNNLQNVCVEDVQKVSMQQGIEDSLKSLILNYASKSLKTYPIKIDNLEFINQSMYKWTEILLKNYDYVNEKYKFQKKNNEEEESELLYFYDENNLLNFILNIKNPTTVNFQLNNNSLIKLSIIMPSYQDLKERYATLLQNDNIDISTLSQQEMAAVTKDRDKRARQLVENEALESEIENFAQGGIPNGERVEILRKYFGIENSNFKQYNQIEEELEKNEGIYEQIMEDDSEIAYEDERYFVFQEPITKVIKVFMRDSEIPKKLRIIPQNLDKLTMSEQLKVPPCGIIPSKYFSRYALPFGYCSIRCEVMYSIFREFYCRYFCFLNSISSLPQSILGLSMMFEDLFQQTDNRLFSHLVSIQIDPLKIAFPWLFYCFIGYLEVDQLFFIFDRIVGYKSCEIIAIFAVGIFKNRSKLLFNCKCKEEAENLLVGQLEDNFLDTIRNYFSF